MTKRASALALVLQPRTTGVTAQSWLYSALRNEILAGRLRPATRLPATRDLAAQYGLSRGTIIAAFDQLRAEGYLEGKVGSGTYVAEILPRAAGPTAPRITTRAPRRLSGYGRRIRAFPALGPRPMRAFRANQPALDLFPTTLWAQVAARRLRHATSQHLEGDEPFGHRPLREAIADYLVTSRGVRCSPQQIVIVSGVQAALDLVARLFLDPGDKVVMENPGYVGASLVFEALGARIAPAQLDEQGLKLRPGDASARLIYATPAHQFPVGVSMSIARRLELIEFARKSNTVILEDDYDSEFRYSGRPLPALQGLDQHGVVIFAGSFSKVLFPSLRLGYLVLPPDLIETVGAIQSVTNRHAPTLVQSVLCDFMVAGHFARHIRRMREIYAERLSVLLESARSRLDGLLDVSDVEAGLQTAGWLAGSITGEAAAAAAAARKVEVGALSAYAVGKFEREGLQLGFAAVDTQEIKRGVRDLAAALESLVKPQSRHR
jgi:GntR family transcriptional regulator/MocR family aminotransferase